MGETHYTLADIAEHIGATLKGDGAKVICGIASLSAATGQHVSFLNNTKYVKYLSATHAAAVILAPSYVEKCSIAMLVMDDPYVGYAKVAQLFDRAPAVIAGIHPSAMIGEASQIAASATVAANVVIGEGVRIGEQTQIHPGVVIADNVTIGNHCIIFPNVTLYHDVNIANRVHIHANTVIGSDGFGNARDKQGVWLKIPQLGAVDIHDDVEIGASVTIDRGALDDTVIARGVKLDNQIQVGHNVHIGENTAIAAGTGIAGSTRIGKNCMISGLVGFAGHFDVADGAVITGMTKVTKAITKPGIYSSGTVIEPHRDWLKHAVHFRQLGDIVTRIKKLELSIKDGFKTEGVD